MPNIFKNENRDRVKEEMYKIGFNLIKKYGIKKTCVEDITKATGIAKGTFYNFFETKEKYIYEIILYNRSNMKQKIQEMIAQKDSLKKEDVRKILLELTFDSSNIYTYLDDDDIRGLELKVPESTSSKSYDNDMALMILNNIHGTNHICDYKIVSNYIKILSLTIMNKEKMQEAVINETIELLIGSVNNYIFD